MERFGRQTPTQSFVLPYEETRAEEAVKLYNASGDTMMEWQELILADIMAVDENNLWIHQKYGYAVPRRNGKSESVIGLCLWALKNQLKVLYTAHRTDTAHAIWERTEKKCKPAGINITSALQGRGIECLQSEDGRVDFKTRTKAGGLGQGYDIVIIDEAQEYTDAQETSLKYVVSDSMNPLTVMLGTPPTEVSVGTVFQKFRKNVLSGEAYSSGWAEWSVPEMHDVEDVDAWYFTNPSMGPLGSILDERKVRAEIGDNDVDFNVQRLGLWLSYNQKSAITPDEWNSLKTDTLPRLTGKLFVGIKYAKNGNNVSMSIAVRTDDGKIFVECIDCRPIRTGNQWIIDFLLRSDYEKVVVDGAGQQQLLADHAKEAGLKKIELPTVKEIIKTNADFEQGFSQGLICHMNQPSLTQSVTNCEKRAIGSNGGFGYNSNKADSDISLMESMILAYSACSESKEKKKQRISY